MLPLAQPQLRCWASSRAQLAWGAWRQQRCSRRHWRGWRAWHGHGGGGGGSSGSSRGAGAPRNGQVQRWRCRCSEPTAHGALHPSHAHRLTFCMSCQASCPPCGLPPLPLQISGPRAGSPWRVQWLATRASSWGPCWPAALSARCTEVGGRCPAEEEGITRLGPSGTGWPSPGWGLAAPRPTCLPAAILYTAFQALASTEPASLVELQCACAVEAQAPAPAACRALVRRDSGGEIY